MFKKDERVSICGEEKTGKFGGNMKKKADRDNRLFKKDMR